MFAAQNETMYKQIIWISVALLPFTSSAQSDGGVKAKNKMTQHSHKRTHKQMDKTLDLLESKQPGLPPATSYFPLAVIKEETITEAGKGKRKATDKNSNKL